MTKEVTELFVDLETTGLEIGKDKILEIAAIAVDSDKNEIARFHEVIPVWPLASRLVPLTNGNVAELDVYEGYHAGKVTVEVEFGSVEEAEAFQKPDWFGLELTNDKKWSNRSMARQSAKYAELERLLDEGLASGVALEGSSVFARLRARLKL
jgi:hypothetical protein